tara:strand:- start:23 stop:259 length:237 start_codon:yes stop_codon:yes gene_type:complete
VDFISVVVVLVVMDHTLPDMVAVVLAITPLVAILLTEEQVVLKTPEVVVVLEREMLDLELVDLDLFLSLIPLDKYPKN